MVDTPRTRWYRPSPSWLLIGLLFAEAILWLSDRLGWPRWHKGYAVLVTVTGVGGFVLLVLLWFLGALAVRWRFQFSTRSLFALTVAVGVPFSWLAAERKNASEQRAIVDEIRTWGGVLSYDWEWDSEGRPVPNAMPPEPAWLRNLFGRAFFETLTGIGLDNTQVTDADLEHVKGLSDLQVLRLAGTNVTDAGLDRLRGLTQLRELSLNDTQVTDVGSVSGLIRLQKLLLFKSQVTDAGLKRIEGLKQLQWLWLGHRYYGFGHSEHLKGLSHLQDLMLDNTGVTDAGLENLEGLSQLQMLTLNNTRVTDAGLEHSRGGTPPRRA